MANRKFERGLNRYKRAPQDCDEMSVGPFSEPTLSGANRLRVQSKQTRTRNG